MSALARWEDDGSDVWSGPSAFVKVEVVAVYLRISLDRYGLRLGVDRQRKEVRALVAARWPHARIVEYEDNNRSALKTRKRFKEMLDDARAGKVQAIAAWSVDRLMRRLSDLEQLIEIADDRRLDLATVGGHVDLGTAPGRAVVRMLTVMAALEVELKGDRQDSAHTQRREAAQTEAGGKPWVTRRPFGFADLALNHHRVEAPQLRQMYAEVIAGASLRALARRLNADGIATSTGGQWSDVTVRQVLTNPTNAGLLPHYREFRNEDGGVSRKRKTVGKGNWLPIVTEDIFRAAEAAMAGRRGKAGPARTTKHLLSGILVCDACGTGLTHDWVTDPKGGEPKSSYRCSRNRCVTRSGAALEAIVGWLVVGRLTRDDAPDLLLAGREDLAELAEEKRALELAKGRAYRAMINGAVTEEEWEPENARLLARLAEIEAEAKSDGRAGVLGPVLLNGPEGVPAAWAAAPDDHKRAIIGELMTIRVRKVGRGRRVATTIPGTEITTTVSPDDLAVEWVV